MGNITRSAACEAFEAGHDPFEALMNAATEHMLADLGFKSMEEFEENEKTKGKK